VYKQPKLKPALNHKQQTNNSQRQLRPAEPGPAATSDRASPAAAQPPQRLPVHL